MAYQIAPHRPFTPLTPVHSPHPSSGSIRPRTPGQLSLHEYRQQQAAPSPQAVAGQRTVKRKAAAGRLNQLETDSGPESAKTRISTPKRPLSKPSSTARHDYSSTHIDFSSTPPPTPYNQQNRRAQSRIYPEFEHLHSDSSSTGSQKSLDSSPSSTRSLFAGGVQVLPQIASHVRFNPIKKLPRPDSADRRPRFTSPVYSLVPGDEAERFQPFTSTSTFSLSKFPFPDPPRLDIPRSPQIPQHKKSPLNEVANTVLNYKGATFNIVNPHDSLRLSDVYTSLDSDPQESSASSRLLSEQDQERMPYDTLAEARRGILGKSPTISPSDTPVPQDSNVKQAQPATRSGSATMRNAAQDSAAANDNAKPPAYSSGGAPENAHNQSWQPAPETDVIDYYGGQQDDLSSIPNEYLDHDSVTGSQYGFDIDSYEYEYANSPDLGNDTSEDDAPAVGADNPHPYQHNSSLVSDLIQGYGDQMGSTYSDSNHSFRVGASQHSIHARQPGGAPHSRSGGLGLVTEGHEADAGNDHADDGGVYYSHSQKGKGVAHDTEDDSYEWEDEDDEAVPYTHVKPPFPVFRPAGQRPEAESSNPFSMESYGDTAELLRLNPELPGLSHQSRLSREPDTNELLGLDENGNDISGGPPWTPVPAPKLSPITYKSDIPGFQSVPEFTPTQRAFLRMQANRLAQADSTPSGSGTENSPSQVDRDSPFRNNKYQNFQSVPNLPSPAEQDRSVEVGRSGKRNKDENRYSGMSNITGGPSQESSNSRIQHPVDATIPPMWKRTYSLRTNDKRASGVSDGWETVEPSPASNRESSMADYTSYGGLQRLINRNSSDRMATQALSPIMSSSYAQRYRGPAEQSPAIFTNKAGSRNSGSSSRSNNPFLSLQRFSTPIVYAPKVPGRISPDDVWEFSEGNSEVEQANKHEQGDSAFIEGRGIQVDHDETVLQAGNVDRQAQIVSGSDAEDVPYQAKVLYSNNGFKSWVTEQGNIVHQDPFGGIHHGGNVSDIPAFQNRGNNANEHPDDAMYDLEAGRPSEVSNQGHSHSTPMTAPVIHGIPNNELSPEPHDGIEYGSGPSQPIAPQQLQGEYSMDNMTKLGRHANLTGSPGGTGMKLAGSSLANLSSAAKPPKGSPLVTMENANLPSSPAYEQGQKLGMMYNHPAANFSTTKVGMYHHPAASNSTTKVGMYNHPTSSNSTKVGMYNHPAASLGAKLGATIVPLPRGARVMTPSVGTSSSAGGIELQDMRGLRGGKSRVPSSSSKGSRRSVIRQTSLQPLWIQGHGPESPHDPNNDATCAKLQPPGGRSTRQSVHDEENALTEFPTSTTTPFIRPGGNNGNADKRMSTLLTPNAVKQTEAMKLQNKLSWIAVGVLALFPPFYIIFACDGFDPLIGYLTKYKVDRFGRRQKCVALWLFAGMCLLCLATLVSVLTLHAYGVL
ncbi:hypothetical protein EJ06DRAFT_575403 [Trichodelitschia bisporula]|uniref:Uncharacterized protein n=1 Tax=Trichodelitschia bisporula TaxID=703511 RepID=A0A6G1I1H2_9PEZI|nr:hypothetical protein EJ06DRAFT_575403 [Trichodelitschia bisporula]